MSACPKCGRSLTLFCGQPMPCPECYSCPYIEMLVPPAPLMFEPAAPETSLPLITVGFDRGCYVDARGRRHHLWRQKGVAA